MKKNLPVLIAVILLSSCQGKDEITDTDPLKVYIDSVKTVFAPDKRVALFDVNSVQSGTKTVLKGMTNLPEALADLKSQLSEANVTYIDSVEVLPLAAFKTTRAVIKISVANLRSKPKHSAELATQATLGTPVNVYKKVANWYLIQTPDMYLSWVDSGGIQLMSEDQFANWKASPKLIYLKTSGFSYQNPSEKSQTISDLVAGDVLELLSENSSFYQVEYPDNRLAFIPKSEAVHYDIWLNALNPTEESLIATSKTMMGAPYLWGGTSTKGMDCSGFTKTVFFLNGLVIPRDASQQVHTGELIDEKKDFSNLKPGDLLFFGKPATETTKERIIHVGMWIGNNEFIHSAGRVHISSMDKSASNYDAYNHNRYLRTKRVLNKTDENIINLADQSVFKD